MWTPLDRLSPAAALTLLVPIAYLVGSIPFGLLVGKLKGVDVRAGGSRNIGATNVGRLLGRPWFFVVFALDAAKGLAPMLAASFVAWRVAPIERTPGLYALWLAVGLAAFLGHCFSAFLKFKGGKGVATSVGILMGMVPYLMLPGVVGLLVFAAVLKFRRYVSVASLAAAVAVPAAYVALGWLLGWDVFGRQWPVLAIVCAMAATIWWKHRSNLARLRAGTEVPNLPRRTRRRAPDAGGAVTSP